jgi:ABC-type sugar transport system permease subunit
MLKIIIGVILILFVLFLILFIYEPIYLKIKYPNLFYTTKPAFTFDKNINYERKNICIVTIETRKMKLLDLHNKNISDYVKLHNYRYIFKDNYQSELPLYWWKLQVILEIFNEYGKDVDYVMWMDSDTIICHPEIPLELLLNLSKNSSTFIGTDWEKKTLNAGIFIVKNDQDGKYFLNECLYLYMNSIKCNKSGKFTLDGRWAGRCYEQGMMNHLLNSSKYRKMWYKIPLEFLINGKNGFGAFMVHLYGDKKYAEKEFTKFLSTKSSLD